MANVLEGLLALVLLLLGSRDQRVQVEGTLVSICVLTILLKASHVAKKAARRATTSIKGINVRNGSPCTYRLLFLYFLIVMLVDVYKYVSVHFLFLPFSL